MLFEMKFQVDHLDRALAAVRQAISHPEEMLGNIGESLLRVNRDRHNAGLAPDGAKWKELSPLTPKEGRKGGVLAKSGRMLQSFNYRVVNKTLSLGFDGTEEQRRADRHNRGSKPYVILPKNKKALAFAGIVRKRVSHPGLPKRQLVGLPESDCRLVADVSVDYLTVILNRVR